MSTESQPAAAWPALTTNERRVLGVLVEKAKTTPDAYPLSVNALVTGCNQKSNRDPVLNLSDPDVEETLAELQKKGLVIRVQGHGRVERWRHSLYESWQVDKVELAVLAELLLRGAQTEGELRARASRMEPIADLDALRQICRPLADRGLLVYLTPEGRRGTTLTHGFLRPKELEHARSAAGAAETAAEATPVREMAGVRETQADATGLAEARAEIEGLRKLVTHLQATVTALGQEVRALKEALGI